MARERIDIVVSERGSRTVRKNIVGIGQGAQGAARHLGRMTLALQTIAAGSSGAVLVNLLDTFILMQNRLANVTKSTLQASAVMQELFRVSNETRTSFELTSTVYTRAALAMRDLGIAQSETLAFTKTLNQAVVLSGSSASEAWGAMIQLSQGLASGTLRGDELRSVLEQLPAVADIIADHLATTRGELREMGFAGEITADKIIKAFQEAREEINERFKRTIPTISQSFTVLRNKVIETLGEFNKATGVLQLLSGAILFAADNVEILLRAFAALAIMLTVGLVAKAFVFLATTVAGVVAVFSGSAGLVALLGGLVSLAVVAGAVFVAFGDKLKLSSDGAATAIDLVSVAWDRVRNSSVAAGAASLLALDLTVNRAQEVDLSTLLRDTGAAVDTLIAVAAGTANAVKAALADIPAAIVSVFIQGFNGAQSSWASFRTRLLQSMGAFGEKMLKAFPNNFKDLENPFQESGERVGTAFKEGFIESIADPVAFNFISGLLEEAETKASARVTEMEERTARLAQALKDLENAGVNRVKGDAQKKKTLKALDALRAEARLLGLTNREREVQSKLLEVTNSLKGSGIDIDKAGNEGLQRQFESLIRGNQALSDRADILDNIRQPQEDFSRDSQALSQLVSEGEINLRQYTDQMLKLRQALLDTRIDAMAGFESGILRITETTGDLASAISDGIVNAFESATEALVNFVKTGKLDITSLVDTIISQLARIAIQNAIVGPIAAALSAVLAPSGGSGAAPGSFRGAQDVGIAHAGGLVGSSLPTRSVSPSIFDNAQRMHSGGLVLGRDEVPIIAQRGERVLTREQQNQGQGIEINMTVVNNVGAEVKTNASETPGKLNLEVLIDEGAAVAVNTPGSAIQRALQASMGLGRRPINRG